jgi:hypothetical protein
LIFFIKTDIFDGLEKLRWNPRHGFDAAKKRMGVRTPANMRQKTVIGRSGHSLDAAKKPERNPNKTRTKLKQKRKTRTKPTQDPNRT